MKKNTNVKRLKEIITILRKHHLVTNMNPVNLREALEELGPTFIKIGQIMADREDLLENDYCLELRKLRSSVKPMSDVIVSEIIKEELKEKRFDLENIEAIPIGSASIAQVHKATLKGIPVAIKIERENIDIQMEEDISLLKRIVNHFPIKKMLHNMIDINSLLDELLASAKKEMDFLNEASFMEEFRLKNEDVSYIKVPKVYKEYSTSRLLVMEFIDAPRINEIETLTSLGYDMKQIASLLSQNYIKQVIEDGFYHADPHPDNLKIQDNKIVYLDFGMMGYLSIRNKNIIKNCMEAIIFNDIEKLASNIIILGDAKEINGRDFARDLEIVLSKNLNTGIGDIDLKTFAPEVFSIIQKYDIKIPKDITLLIRGIIVLEGVLEDIDKEISLMDALKTNIRPSSVLSKEKLEQKALTFLKNSQDLIELPGEALKLCRSVNDEELRINLNLNSSENEKIIKKKNLSFIALALLDSFLIIAISITSLSQTQKANFYTSLFTSCFIILSIILLFIIFLNFQKRN